MSGRRLGILGGTFDPIHCGHLDLATAAAARLEFDRLIVMPSHTPPHRPQPQATAFHRFAMVALSVAGRRGWMASDDELTHPEPSYTIHTLGRLHARGLKPTDLYFLVGADAFADITIWRAFPDILDAAHFTVVSRPRHAVASLRSALPQLADRMVNAGDWAGASRRTSIILIDAPTADVSSTAIRSRQAAGESIDGMVDPRVQQHIEQHGLYRRSSPDSDFSIDASTAQAGRLHGQK